LSHPQADVLERTLSAEGGGWGDWLGLEEFKEEMTFKYR
jgi:hypothetical protein